MATRTDPTTPPSSLTLSLSLSLTLSLTLTLPGRGVMSTVINRICREYGTPHWTRSLVMQGGYRACIQHGSAASTVHHIGLARDRVRERGTRV